MRRHDGDIGTSRTVAARARRGVVAILLALAVASMANAAIAWPTGASSVIAVAHAAPADRATRAAQRVRPSLQREFDALGLAWGTPVFVRIYKSEGELEVWLRDTPRYRLLKTWPICAYSGTLGPKVKQGDGQAPEGFYSVGARQLNPASSYHLSFNLGYPNAYDRAHGRTGDYLMVHGNCVSIGCYAMGDAAIEEIYTLVASAIAHGQRQVPVHIFPWRFSGQDDPRLEHPQWRDFWRDLEIGHRRFVDFGVPPDVRVAGRRYRFD